MSRFLRPVLGGILASFIATSAFASASSVPTGFTPDPALKTASMTDLAKRIQAACAATQSQLQGGSKQSFQRACGCYASKSLKEFSSEEIQEYRDTGIFNVSARGKALGAIDACGLKRPI